VRREKRELATRDTKRLGGKMKRSSFTTNERSVKGRLTQQGRARASGGQNAKAEEEEKHERGGIEAAEQRAVYSE